MAKMVDCENTRDLKIFNPDRELAPVVHGEWIDLQPQNKNLTRGLHQFICIYGEPNYCPNCGAKMGGEK